VLERHTLSSRRKTAAAFASRVLQTAQRCYFSLSDNFAAYCNHGTFARKSFRAIVLCASAICIGEELTDLQTIFVLFVSYLNECYTSTY